MMRYRSAVTLGAVLSLGLAGCAADDSGPATLETDDQKASYAVGLNVGNNLRQAREVLDMPSFRKGLAHAMAGEDPQLEPEEIQAALQHLNARMGEAREAAAETNREEGEAYLAQNADKDGVTTTESGLQYETLEEGSGEPPAPTDQVSIHYRGTLIDGTEFDSSYERGEPATFGVGGVIPGFSEGLQLMQPGGKYRLVIPSDLAYGPQGTQGDIGPNETLIFEIEMIDVLRTEPAAPADTGGAAPADTAGTGGDDR
jgi:FKBP-type peptidyl-prolyl cis-trans isomerase